MRLFCGFACSLVLLLALAAGGRLCGQEPTPVSVAPRVEQPLTAERIAAFRKEADESSELDEETKKQVAELYRVAQVEFQRAAELTTRANAFITDTEDVAKHLAEVKKQLDELKGKEPPVAAAATLSELEQSHSKLVLQIAAQKKSQAAAEAEPKTRAQRRKEIRGRLISTPERLAELKQAESLPANEHALVVTARKTELAARRLALEREGPVLENELAKYDAEDAVDLVRLLRDRCTQEVALAERHLQVLEDQIKKARAAAAEQAVRNARDEAIEADPILETYAERNRRLAEVAKLITEEFDAADRDLKAAKEVHDELLKQFEQTCKKVESVGLTNSIGALLRKQRVALPDVRKRRATVAGRRKSIDDSQYQMFEYDDERQELANPDVLVQGIVEGAGSRGALQRELLELAAHEVLSRKRDYLDALIRSYNKYFDTLVELDTTEQQIIVLAEQYQKYIDERVLWIRSGNLLIAELQFDQTDAWFLSVHRWAEVPQRLWSDLQKNPIPYLAAVLAFSLLLIRRRGLRNELRAIGETVQRPTCFAFAPTMRAVVLTFAIALLWPGLVGFIAWRLNLTAGGSPFAKAVGNGMLLLCAMWFPLELFRQVCRSHGLAASHFGWPSSATQVLRRNLRWVMWLGLPLTFITSTLVASDPTHGRDAVERSCFILQAIVLAVFLSRVLRPQGGAFQEYIAYHQGGWVDRLKHLWYWAGVVAPLVIAGLAFWGYYYTAQVLSWRLYATICCVVSLVVVRAMLTRLILLGRRKLSIQQARDRAAAAAAAQSESSHASSPAAGIMTDQQQDLSIHSVQTQRLLTTSMLATALIGFWLIWVEVLPALSMLDQWPLWTTTTSVQVVEEVAPSASPLPSMDSQADPVVATRTEYRRTSITFTNVALAVLLAVITFIAARNVPGLLEMSVLQRLPLDASVRYATTSLVSYGIVLLGVIVACSNIGLRWSQIQWLATALTFGLAFGLQEIFANFVAGLIILFERPVRVGDVVTVDDVTGVVSRIRIRATSITNWDRKEYVVPNREFITGRLLNWTLSDKVNRVVITIGIAYGSDTERARELLLKTAHDHPLILKDPPSAATFEGFGDNSLNFTLRTFLPSMENRLQVIHDLHTGIDKAFRGAGIEVAFPQRDLHIRSTPDAFRLTPPQLQEQEDGPRQEAA